MLVHILESQCMGAYMVRDAAILAVIDPTLQLVTQTSDVK